MVRGHRLGDATPHTTFAQSTAGTITAQSHTYADGPATRTVTVKVTDAGSLFDQKTFSVNVNNVAPTASLANNGPIAEGSTGTVTFSAQADASAVDQTAGFTYSYDFNNDGTFEISGSASASATVPASFLADGPGSRTVRGRIIDKDGGFTDYTTTISITQRRPDGEPGQQRPDRRGQHRHGHLQRQADASAVDQAAGFTYSYDFNNDGTFEISAARPAPRPRSRRASLPTAPAAHRPRSHHGQGRRLHRLHDDDLDHKRRPDDDVL